MNNEQHGQSFRHVNGREIKVNNSQQNIYKCFKVKTGLREMQLLYAFFLSLKSLIEISLLLPPTVLKRREQNIS